MRCLKVYLACERRVSPPYWVLIKRGDHVGGCWVAHAIPDKCVLTPPTIIEYVSRCSYYEEELQSNIKVSEVCGDVKRVYVYPKKPYVELRRLYIDPIARGERPLTPGVLLIGAPGTGKSSLARLSARLAGLSVIEISPDKILNMYVGESEKAMKRAVDDAMRHEPCVVLIDDAEWLLSARRLSSVAENAQILLNIQNILFNALQEIHDSGRTVLFIASTNIKPSEIDIAFVRQGRFGPPIFIPLPDYEGLYHFLAQYLPHSDAERYAKMFVNLGLSIADAAGMVERLRKGLEMERKPGGGRGYSRIYVDPVNNFEKILDLLPKEILTRKSRVWIYLMEDIAVAIVAQLAYIVKKPLIRIIDIRYFDEAIYTANALGAITISNTSLPKDIQIYINDNAEGPVFWAGKHGPEVAAFPAISPEDFIAAKEQVLEAVLKYKQIDVDQKIVRKILGLSIEGFIETLEAIASLGHVDDKILARAGRMSKKY